MSILICGLGMEEEKWIRKSLPVRERLENKLRNQKNNMRKIDVGNLVN